MSLTEYNTLATTEVAKSQRIKNYILGSHKVLSRKDFTLNGETFQSAKTVLQSIKPIIDAHTSYLCGNPVSITGEQEQSKLLQQIYKKGNFNFADYKIAHDLICYGNAFSYIYIENGLVKTNVINPCNAYPEYDDYGEYVSFVEKYVNPVTQNVLEIKYEPDVVTIYKNGVQSESYENSSHSLPIHYTSGSVDRSNIFGVGITPDLISIQDEIEQLISNTVDAVNTLSLNSILVISGQKIGDKDNVDSGYKGTVLNLDSGDDAKYLSSTIDSATVKLLIDNLISDFWTVASCPSVQYGQSNIANVSQTTMSILFNGQDAFCKRIGFNMQKGFNKRLEIIGNLLGIDFSDVNISFNYNRPIDVKSTLEALKTQYDMQAISKESIIRQSPLTSNVAEELALIAGDSANADTGTQVQTVQK